jgi:methylated-DNA-[protein]-cysteine S-methyltransferase
MKFPTSTVQSHFETPLGAMILAAVGAKLVGVWFDGQAHQPEMSSWPAIDDHPVLEQAKAQLTEYFAGRRTTFDLPLDVQAGTVFQQAVWCALQKIPQGATQTYGALGASIGNPAAVRAVGGAVGRNPLSIIVPCHRVIGASGALTGYAGGIERKIALLQLEGALV